MNNEVFYNEDILVQEVFLFERLQAHPHQEDLRHLKCIVIARPEDSVSLLCTELANPRYYEISGSFSGLMRASLALGFNSITFKSLILA